ncbi:conserved hypothetical protein [Rhodobacter ferrooxidans]|uniref:Cation transport ATPase n=1 Tax=Rhodobacter ferrooxidans TaxID=371731 RepID=C8RYK6_9RHOB|nr:conserved hypothetical protein [Rhodobacter sp. SW2]
MRFGAVRGRIAWLACLPLLLACVPGAGMRVQPVLGGAVKVAAPGGYCIDPTGVMQGDDSALVLIGRCTGGPGTPQARAILTAAVAAAGSGMDIAANGPALAAYFGSDQGRAALSHSGRAAAVTVQQAAVAGDAFVMRVTDTSPNPDSPAEAASWRAVLGVAGHLVTLTVTGTQAAPLSATSGRALLDGFVAATRAANR